MKQHTVISHFNKSDVQCPKAMIIGGLGVNENAENMSPQSPVKPSFLLRAWLTNPNPPKQFSNRKGRTQVN
jgi:hypothetical protein